MINIGIYSDHKLILEGLCRLFGESGELRLVLKEHSLSPLLAMEELRELHILILNPSRLDKRIMGLLERLGKRMPKLRILILSSSEDERTILQTVKAGAKGFLGPESDPGDLLEAVYSLRSGHDYYSKSITGLLLKQYISHIQSGEEQAGVDSLSARELEVLGLWGSSHTNSEISEKLFISVRTVESHKNHIMQKLNLRTAVDLVKFGIRNNIIEV